MRIRSKIEILADFMTAINTMIDASSQMVHHRQNPKFMAIRDMLHIIKNGAEKLIKDESSGRIS